MTATLNLLDLRPEALAGRTDPAELSDALQAVDRLTPRQQEAIAYAAAYWVVQAIERVEDEESLLLLDKMCAIAARRGSLDETGSAFGISLKTMRDLLEVKRLSVAAKHSGRAGQLLRAQPILDALAHGSLKQSELCARLGLTPGRMSQLLAVMEEGRLISRKRLGKENIVSRSDANGRTVAAPQASQALEASKARFRPLDLLAA